MFIFTFLKSISIHTVAAVSKLKIIILDVFKAKNGQILLLGEMRVLAAAGGAKSDELA